MKRGKACSVDELKKEGILAWYDLRPSSSALCLNMPKQLLDMLENGDVETITVDASDSCSTKALLEQNKTFDYVFMYDFLDHCDDADETLRNVSPLLKDDGKLLILARNKLAVSRFCGYERDVAKHSKSDYESMLKNCGLFAKFFSVFPNLDNAQLIYSEDYLPNESMQVRYLPEYDDTSKVFYRENALCDDLIDNKVLHQFANAYFIECSKNQDSNCLQSATISLKRNRKRAFVTRCFSDKMEKIAYFDEGVPALSALANNQQYLKARGVDVVDYVLKDNVLTAKYIDAPVATDCLAKLAYSDKKRFLQLLDEFYNLVLKSSETIVDEALGPILKRGFIDLVPLNAFFHNERFIVFDQEFVAENIPAALIMYRTILILFEKIEIADSLVTDTELFDRYGITKNKEILSKMEREFIMGLGDYSSGKMATVPQINENRRRLFETDWPSLLSQSRELLIEDRKKHCFDGVADKKLYVWGMGRWADKFMSSFGKALNVVGVIDNALEKQGGSFFGVNVYGPQKLINDSDFKIIICVKNCQDIVSQILSMGIKDFGVYDANFSYADSENALALKNKKYRVGYLSGVFDLYHIGHINMFRRAKEMCDYLIVGVTSDEYVINKKKRTPFIPFDERLAVVASCKYVDKAVKVPYMHEEITEAWETYHYDVQFCGSDYADNPWWLEQQKWLREHGSDLVFFSYTEQTSSTKIKSLIEKGLL